MGYSRPRSNAHRTKIVSPPCNPATAWQAIGWESPPTPRPLRSTIPVAFRSFNAASAARLDTRRLLYPATSTSTAATADAHSLNEPQLDRLLFLDDNYLKGPTLGVCPCEIIASDEVVASRPLPVINVAPCGRDEPVPCLQELPQRCRVDQSGQFDHWPLVDR